MMAFDVRQLFRRRGLGSRIDKELEFHIAALVDEYVESGLPRDEAIRRAHVEFGGVQQVTEDIRDVWTWRWIDDAVRDAQFAVRTYVRVPVFALTAVLTLALGIGVNTALFSVIRQVLIKTLPVPNPEELVEIDCSSGPEATGGGNNCMHSYPAYQLLAERHDGLSGVFAFSPVPSGLVASARGKREVITGQLASANMFDVLGLHPAAGRLLVDSDDRPGAEVPAVLSHGYWLRSFGGDANVIGQSLKLDNHSVTIVGVLPRTFRGVTFGEVYDVVLPLGAADLFRPGPVTPSGTRTPISRARNMGWLTLMGRRQPGATNGQIASRLEPVFRQSIEEAIAPIPLDIRKQLNLSATGIRVNVRTAALGAASGMRRALEPTLRVLAVVVSLVLLIACANLAGLFLGQALNRHREFGLRLALGAKRSRLMRQVFTESLLLAAVGGAAGLLLSQWVAPAAFALATDETGLRAVDMQPDRWVLAFTAFLSIVVALAVGATSVQRASRTQPQEVLRNVGRAASPRLAKALVAAQIAFTMTLVGSAGLFLQTLTNFRRVDVGFEPKQLVTITMDTGIGSLDAPRASEYVRLASEALAGLPGVRAVTYSNRAPGTGVPMNLMLDVPGFTGSTDAAASGLIYAGSGFVRTLGLTLLTGRDLEPSDQTGSHVAVVNESFATRFFGTTNVVGRTFALRGPANPQISIIGIVKDARDAGVKRETQPVMYLPLRDQVLRAVTFTVRADTPNAFTADAAQRTLNRIDPGIGVARIKTVEAQFDDVLRRERLLAALGSAFGGLALLLLGIGMYGMLDAMVVRRTPEIGIRMALGADRGQLVWMVSRETLTVLGIGIGLGVLGHLAVARAIQNQLFGVEPTDAFVTAFAVSTLVTVAAIAVWLPAKRATKIEPIEALRHDYA
jgi:predicted permease